MFRRDFGMVGHEVGGGSGVPVEPDGSFVHITDPGIYTRALTEFSAPDSDGRVLLVEIFGEVRLDSNVE